MNLFFYGLILQISSVIIIIIIKNNLRANIIAHITLVFGLILSFISTINMLLFSDFEQLNLMGLDNISSFFRFDSLSLYFLGIIELVAIPTTIFSFSYFKYYALQGRHIRSTLIFYALMIISTQLVVVANHSILFLICFEAMSMSAYLGMIFDKEKKDVQTGSFYYLVMNHIVIFILYIFFFLLHHETGSWLFSDFHISKDTGIIFFILYALSLTGFGMKAGFMPFHFWLPRAHPIAPTVFSSFLSGVIIKTGIYGILRTFQFLNPAPLWIGWIVFIIGMISAVFGVWYALAQHDIKKLLAYHSVENIGIIGIGIGLGFIGSAYNSVPIQILGFGGALLHTLNHSIFKSLLFIGSGVINQNLGTRNIEQMGGIVHRNKYFVILFVIGSIAICGIPPLNGFISEFIIFNGFFSLAKILRDYYPLLMLLSVVCLAFVGGLAAACFTKINSIMFLGTARKEMEHFNVSIYDYISMGILAFFCIIIGVYPKPFIVIISKVINPSFIPVLNENVLLNGNWIYISLIFSGLLAGVILIYFIKLLIQKKYGRRDAAAWGCGYEDQTPKMQYTASSFADELNEIPKSILLYDKKFKYSKNEQSVPKSFKSHSQDFIDHIFIIPVFKKIRLFISRTEFLNHSDIRYYVAAFPVIIIIYCVVAFLWN